MPLYELTYKALGDVDLHLEAPLLEEGSDARRSIGEAIRQLRRWPSGHDIDAALKALDEAPDDWNERRAKVERLRLSILDLLDMFHEAKWRALLIELGHDEADDEDEETEDDLDSVQF